MRRRDFLALGSADLSFGTLSPAARAALVAFLASARQ
jgi:hypothetical protein